VRKPCRDLSFDTLKTLAFVFILAIHAKKHDTPLIQMVRLGIFVKRKRLQIL
jgi:hypothetical protein